MPHEDSLITLFETWGSNESSDYLAALTPSGSNDRN